VHDVSDGGVLVAIAEMALASGIGAHLEFESELPLSAWAFAEDQGLFVVTTSDEPQLQHNLGWSFPAYRRIGTTGGRSIKMQETEIPLADLRAAHEGFFPKLMGSELTPEF
jgi:phosphoribosylformylglycinamidine synthase